MAADPQTCVAVGAAMHAGVLAGLLSGTAELSDSTYQTNLHDRRFWHLSCLSQR